MLSEALLVYFLDAKLVFSGVPPDPLTGLCLNNIWRQHKSSGASVDAPWPGERKPISPTLMVGREMVRDRMGVLSTPHTTGSLSTARLITELPEQTQNHLLSAPGDSGSARKYSESLGKKTEGSLGAECL